MSLDDEERLRYIMAATITAGLISHPKVRLVRLDQIRFRETVVTEAVAMTDMLIEQLRVK